MGVKSFEVAANFNQVAIRIPEVHRFNLPEGTCASHGTFFHCNTLRSQVRLHPLQIPLCHKAQVDGPRGWLGGLWLKLTPQLVQVEFLVTEQ